MLKIALFILSFLITSIAYGCECGSSIGSNFLNQVKNFDAIVLGTFERDERENERENERAYLVIEKIYKGNIEKDTINLLDGGLDCYSWLDFKPGTRVILGLDKSPYSGNPNTFMVPGCVTASLFLSSEDVVVTTSKSKLPSIKKARIGWIRKKMDLSKFEEKVLNKI